MSLKKLLRELDRQENDYAFLEKEIEVTAKEFEDLMKEALDLKKEKEELLERKQLLENKDADINKNDIEEINKIKEVMPSIDKLLQRIEQSKTDIKNIKIKKEERHKEFEVEINKHRLIINKAIEIQELGANLYLVSILYVLTGILTIVQRNNFDYIEKLITETDNIFKSLLFFALISLIEGNIVSNRSIDDAEKYVQDNQKVKLWKVLKFPNLFEGGILSLVIIYLYFPNFIGVLLNHNFGIVIVVWINAFIITLIALQIKDFIELIYLKFNRSITEPKEKLTAVIAIMGAVISLIALFR